MPSACNRVLRAKGLWKPWAPPSDSWSQEPSIFISTGRKASLSSMVSTGLDSACGYAAFTLMLAEAAVLTIEFKINLLAPAKGQRFRMEGRVLKPGRTISVCEGRAYALQDGHETLVATMGCTLMAVTGRPDVQG